MRQHEMDESTIQIGDDCHNDANGEAYIDDSDNIDSVITLIVAITLISKTKLIARTSNLKRKINKLEIKITTEKGMTFCSC
jgi:hypothetical protein